MQKIDPSTYDQQLNEKVATLNQLFSTVATPDFEVFPSPPLHYRMRAEFRVWHDGDDLYYIMFNRETRQKYRVDEFPVGTVLMNTVMKHLIGKVRENPVLRLKLFQIDFLTTLSGEVLVSMLYHRKLDEEWTSEARQLKRWFELQHIPFNLIGRARKMKIALDCDFVIEQLNVQGKTFIYKQVENSFSQPNAHVAEKMLEWALNCTQNSTGDLLELYCGNGNFSLALAQNFRQVLATEQSKPSVKAAQYNIEANCISNVHIVRMSAEEITLALEGKKEFNRVKNAGVDLTQLNCSTVLVDPPRAGLDNDTCLMIQKYDNILYISCNPITLNENLEILLQTHNIERFAVFDQFPYTHHIEVGVYLVRKP